MLLFVGTIYSIGMELEFLTLDASRSTDNRTLAFHWDAKTDRPIASHCDYMMLGY